jgi:hypothetical protein
MLPPVLLASATSDSLALIAVFGVLFPALAMGLIAFAIATALGERRANQEYTGRRRQDPSRG